jgi:hypothetical protein
VPGDLAAQCGDGSVGRDFAAAAGRRGGVHVRDSPVERGLAGHFGPARGTRQHDLLLGKKITIMPTATLNLTVISKRMLTKREGAEHCGRPLKAFEIECPVSPVRFPNGDLRWDVHDLDVWLDSLKVPSDDIEAIVRRLGS